MKWLTLNKKSQVAPFLVLLIAVLLLAIVATMLIGEAAFIKIRMGNAADGALLTASSSYCRSLNQIRQIKGSLEVNQWFLQSFLFAHRTTCCGVVVAGWKFKGEPLASGTYINTMLTNKQLYDTAKSLANNSVKELRSDIYDGIFGSGLIDEPKPFLGSEVTRDAQNRVVNFDFKEYLKRDPRLTLVMRQFKKDNYDGWYKNSSLTYYFSKNKDKVLPLLNDLGEPSALGLTTFKAEAAPDVFPGSDANALDAYFNVTMAGFPQSVSVESAIWPLVYFIWKEVPCIGCCCVVMPGFIPNPYSSLRMSINPESGEDDGKHLEVDVAKSAPYKVIFFERQIKTEHKSKVYIKGSITSGFEPKME